MSIVCRRAGPEDADRVAVLYDELYEVLNGFDLPFTLRREELADMLSIMLKSKLCYICVAERENGDICGFVSAGIMRIDKKLEHRGGALTGRLHDIYVEPEIQGQGTAERLLSMLEEWFKDNGAAIAETHVQIKNERSLSFFKKHGYRVMGQIVYKELQG